MSDFRRAENDAFLQLIQEEKSEEFNRRKAAGEIHDLSCASFRGLDLRQLDVDGLDFHDSYFRNTDLRGLDLRNCDLRGASFRGAHVSGTYFPEQISADEIRLSIELGIRVRY